MPTQVRRLSFVALVLACGVSWTQVQAAPTAEQREAVKVLNVALTKAGNFFKDGKHKESAEITKDIQAKVEKLAADGNKDVRDLLEPLYGKLDKLHGWLELEGFTLAPLKRPEEMPAAEAKPGTKSGAKPGAADPGNGKISFANHVAPILIGKCGNCHVRNARGRFSMSSFENLMKGPPAGKVIFPGDPSGSRLIEVIESGDMPRGGLKVEANELALLKKWIADGAKFDGQKEDQNLAELAPNAKPEEGMKVAVVAATGKETISFARDVAPVLDKNCAGCHGNMRPSQNFNLATFANMLKGGDSGAPISPTKGADSLLIKKLKGTADGQRMPRGLPPLADDVIAKIETWINEGAKYDGGDPNTDVKLVAALDKARRSTHEELSADRAILADEHWKLGSPGITASKFESTNFLVMGDVGENTLKDIGERAEALAPKIATFFKVDSEKALIKGRFTLFVFGERYAYSEFGNMVEKRSLPKEWRGHWLFNTVDSYGAVIPPRTADYTLEGIIFQQLSGAYIASQGKVPHWFAEGSARVAATKLTGSGDSRIQKWNERISEAVGTMTKPDDFMGGSMDSELSDVASFSFVNYLMTDGKRYFKLLDEVRKGAPFDQSFAATYGAPPAQVTADWVRKAASAKPARPTKKK